MGFTPLPEEEMLKALDGQEFILGEIDSAATDRIKSERCPECHTSALPVVDPHCPFGEGAQSVKYIARCPACMCVFDPDTQSIRTPGTTTAHY